jgi:2-C-methyl-D-erythritol 4-phosphate cytidylyltransferase
MTAWAIIVAGGTGTRMGAEVPKQLLKLKGRTILDRTLDPFRACPDIAGVIIAAAPSVLEHVESAILPAECGETSIMAIPGGEERQDSVRNALSEVPSDTDVIVVHDAVRPFIRSELINECVAAARRRGAVSVMLPVTETIKVVTSGRVFNTPDRATLWITQTPQAFQASILRAAHEAARHDGIPATDDCMLAERLGHPVYVVEGSDENIKITTPTDLAVAAALLDIFEHGGKNA